MSNKFPFPLAPKMVNQGREYRRSSNKFLGVQTNDQELALVRDNYPKGFFGDKEVVE